LRAKSNHYIPGGKTAREVAEQKRINEVGGTKNKPASQTSNERNPIGKGLEKKIEDEYGPRQIDAPMVTMSPKTIAKELNGHLERNRELRAKFEQQKVDLDEPRPIEFHFWAWTQRDAVVLGRSLRTEAQVADHVAGSAQSKRSTRSKVTS
jgi:hypothetical protein